LTTPAAPDFLTRLDQLVAEAQAFEPLLASLITQFVPALAPFLPEIGAVLTAGLSAAHKATGTVPAAPPPLTP
jgi:hypothetical protein